MLLIASVLCTNFHSAQAATLDQAAAVRLCREYLESRDSAERRRLAARLAEYGGRIEPVLAQLRSQQYGRIKSGYHPEEHFSQRSLRKKHPDDLLYFVVPKEYRAERPTGLIVFMHGGGSSSSRRAPRVYMNFPDDPNSTGGSQIGDLLSATGMVAVGPSAPWDESTAYRWCVEKSDDYLTDVIHECQTRFNIDPDRVFLMGHSMGGFGTYHHVLRQPDRFAAAIVSAGSWSQAYWPVIQGTPLFIVQGAHDARAGVRWHYTDVQYGRWTDKLLTRGKLDHTYVEHDGKHAISYGRKEIAAVFRAAEKLRRNPYYPHVALASPNGFKESFAGSVQHNRWLTLNEATSGKIEYDELRSLGTGEFSSWHLEHRKRNHSGAAIDAVNQGGNSIRVTTQNVARFTVWLHPKMIDVEKPVRIVVDGRTLFRGTVKPSLATALESFERREDWGLVYPIKVELKLRP